MPDKKALDLNYLNDQYDGIFEILFDAYKIFVENSKKQMADLKMAIDSKNAADIQKISHSIKGSVSNLGGLSVQQVAKELEGKGRTNDLTDINDLYLALLKEIDQFHVAFIQFKNSHDQK